MRRYELREDQWLKIAPLLPGKVTDPGRSGEDNRQFVQAVLWIARSGAPGETCRNDLVIVPTAKLHVSDWELSFSTFQSLEQKRGLATSF
jgi:transposase